MKPVVSAITLISLLLIAQPAAAQEESLTARAASSLTLFIASQGNAALTQIRNELKKDLLQQLKPYLPEDGRAKPAAPADKNAAPAAR